MVTLCKKNLISHSEAWAENMKSMNDLFILCKNLDRKILTEAQLTGQTYRVVNI